MMVSKILKQIEFMIKNICRIIVEKIIGFLIIRDKKIVVIGQRTPLTKFLKVSKDYCMHNTKYFFLKYANDNDIKLIYLCDDAEMRKKFNECGFKNVYPRQSLKGFCYSLRAKYWLYNNWKYDINLPILSSGAICINLWHGIPLKKIGYDIGKTAEILRDKNPILYKIYKALQKKDDYYVVNSEYEQAKYETAFLIGKKNIKIIGSPRCDIFYNDIKYSDIFMEEDFTSIKRFKEQGKKLFFYTPTFRDTGKDISGWLKSEKLKTFLRENNAILVCKLHFADKNSLNFELPEEFYKMDSNSDIYPVLEYSDALITDYSSIYFDYLLLDKPILYYIPDLEEYTTQCRGFYRNYDELTAGVKVTECDDLIAEMNDVIDGIDNYKEAREKLCKEMFKNQDGQNCVRLKEFIKSL